MVWITICIFLIATFYLIPVHCHDPPNPRKLKISTSLNNFFDTDETATRNVVVDFKRKPGEVLNMFDLGNFDMMPEDIQVELHRSYVDQLKLLRDESQSNALQFLKSEAPGSFKSFWVSNTIHIKGATMELCQAMSSFDNVDSITEELIFHIHNPVGEDHIVDESRKLRVEANSVEWNIQKVQAPKMWEQGITGVGTVAGIIDTGMNTGHECFTTTKILAWSDPINGKSRPYDDNGHGTHVAGTICGGNGIGVAPGTSLVLCKACDSGGSCPQEALTSCCQFMTEWRPNVVSNSWGGPSDFSQKSAYRDIIIGWNSMGMFPVFSAGNSGPSCGTMGSPGDYPQVCSVGATNSTDGIASFSSRGQCKSGRLGPTCCAPGHKITSAWIGSSTKYNTISGTSMAAPHVTGLYSLMRQANAQLTPDQARAAVVASCQTESLVQTQQTCGGTSFDDVPNNMYGNGRIDCVKAVSVANSFESGTKNK